MPGEKHVYSVITVNGTGLKSPPAEAQPAAQVRNYWRGNRASGRTG
jgi:hypothetical protein